MENILYFNRSRWIFQFIAVSVSFQTHQTLFELLKFQRFMFATSILSSHIRFRLQKVRDSLWKTLFDALIRWNPQPAIVHMAKDVFKRFSYVANSQMKTENSEPNWRRWLGNSIQKHFQSGISSFYKGSHFQHYVHEKWKRVLYMLLHVCKAYIIVWLWSASYVLWTIFVWDAQKYTKTP